LAYKNSGRYNFGFAINEDGSWYVKFDIDSEAVVISRGNIMLTPVSRKYVPLVSWENFEEL